MKARTCYLLFLIILISNTLIAQKCDSCTYDYNKDGYEDSLQIFGIEEKLQRLISSNCQTEKYYNDMIIFTGKNEIGVEEVRRTPDFIKYRKFVESFINHSNASFGEKAYYNYLSFGFTEDFINDKGKFFENYPNSSYNKILNHFTTSNKNIDGELFSQKLSSQAPKVGKYIARYDEKRDRFWILYPPKVEKDGDIYPKLDSYWYYQDFKNINRFTDVFNNNLQVTQTYELFRFKDNKIPSKSTFRLEVYLSLYKDADSLNMYNDQKAFLYYLGKIELELEKDGPDIGIKHLNIKKNDILFTDFVIDYELDAEFWVLMNGNVEVREIDFKYRIKKQISWSYEFKFNEPILDTLVSKKKYANISNMIPFSIYPNDKGNYYDTTGFFVDNRDHKIYKWVKIGGQVWMAENLAWLPQINKERKSSAKEPFYYVNDFKGKDINEAKLSDYYKVYGVLYNYIAAENACPDGWHLPSHEEWKILELTLGVPEKEIKDLNYRMVNIAGILKEDKYWRENEKNNNLSKLAIRPAGGKYMYRDIDYVGLTTTFWSSTLKDNYSAFSRSVHDNILTSISLKGDAWSIRCLKD